MLIDFDNSFTDILSTKFAGKQFLNKYATWTYGQQYCIYKSTMSLNYLVKCKMSKFTPATITADMHIHTDNNVAVVDGLVLGQENQL